MCLISIDINNRTDTNSSNRKERDMANKYIRNAKSFKYFVIIFTITVANLILFSDSILKQQTKNEAKKVLKKIEELQDIKQPASAAILRSNIGLYIEALSGMLGDVNGDSQITQEDADLISDYVVGKIAELPRFELADVDWDMDITIIDAMLISQTVTMGDRIPPNVVKIRPKEFARNVPADTSIFISFSEPIDVLSLDSLTIKVINPSIPFDTLGSNFVEGSLSIFAGDTVVVFTPSIQFEHSTEFMVIIQNVKDLAGNKMKYGFASTFRTKAEESLGPVGTVSGVVLDEIDYPVSGVMIKILDEIETVDFGITNGKEVIYTTNYDNTPTDTTDMFGRFFIEDIPEGRIKLLIDGRTVDNDTITYPPTTYLLDVIANQDNNLRKPIYLQSIDMENIKQLNPDTVTIVTSPLAPGFSLKVLPGSARFLDGTICEELGVTIIPKKTEPSLPPPGYGFSKCYRLYPTGVYFDPPAEVTYPAPEGLIPGEEFELAEYDYDACKYVITGKLVVNEDASLLKSKLGVGLIWTCCNNPIFVSNSAYVLGMPLWPNPNNWKPSCGKFGLKMYQYYLSNAYLRYEHSINSLKWFRDALFDWRTLLIAGGTGLVDHGKSILCALSFSTTYCFTNQMMAEIMLGMAKQQLDRCTYKTALAKQTRNMNNDCDLLNSSILVIDLILQKFEEANQKLQILQSAVNKSLKIFESEPLDEETLTEFSDIMVSNAEELLNVFAEGENLLNSLLRIMKPYNITSSISVHGECNLSNPDEVEIINLGGIQFGPPGCHDDYENVSAGLFVRASTGQTGVTGADGAFGIGGVQSCLMRYWTGTGAVEIIDHPAISVDVMLPSYIQSGPSFSIIDSDNDGMPDDWERNNGLSTEDSTDAFTDADNDTLINVMEFLSFLDPHNPDTDGDGIGDYREVLGGHSYNYEYPITQPRIFTLSPNVGAPGDSVIITGEGFGDTTSTITVSFNGVSAGHRWLTSTTIKAAVPEGVRSGPVYVAVDGKVSTPQTFYLDTTPGSFEDITIIDTLAYVVDGPGVAGLQIFSIVDPDNPKLLGACDVPGYPVRIQVKDQKAYVSKAAPGSTSQPPGTENGLTIVDVSDPYNPFVQGSIQIKQYDSYNFRWNYAPIHDFKVVGDRAYVVYDPIEKIDRICLSVIDVSSSTNPKIIDTMPLEESSIGGPGGFSIATQGVLACVGIQSGWGYPHQFSIVDVFSNPYCQKPLGYMELPGKPHDISLKGNYAFIAADQAGLCVVDISDPTSPNLLVTVPAKHITYDLFLCGDSAYVADGDSGVTVFDISNPALPILTRTYHTPGTAKGIIVKGNQLFVADGTAGLHKIAISSQDDLTPPTVAGFFPVSGSTAPIISPITILFSDLIDLNTINDATFMVSGSKGTIPGRYTINENVVTYEPNPPFVPAEENITWTVTDGIKDWAGNALITTSNNFNSQFIYAPIAQLQSPGDAYRVYVQDDKAYMAFGIGEDMYATGGLKIFDVSNPLYPSELGTLELGGNAIAVTVNENTAYLSFQDKVGPFGQYQNYIASVDVGIPTSPALLDTIVGTMKSLYGDFFSTLYPQLIIRGDCLYASGSHGYGYENFAVIDISDPSTLRFISKNNFKYGSSNLYNRGLSLDGRFAYVLGSTGNNLGLLSVLDISSDPLQVTPICLETLPVQSGNPNPYTGIHHGMEARGIELTVACGDSGLKIFNVLDPQNPTELGSGLFCGPVHGLDAVSDSAFLADYTCGLTSVNISDPTILDQSIIHCTNGGARYVFVSSQYAYICDFAGNVQIIPIMPGEDVINPAIYSIRPLNGETAPHNTPISVTFSETVDPSTVSSNSFRVSADGQSITGDLTIQNDKVTFVPNDFYPANEIVNVSVTTEIKDLAGNPLESEFNSSFTSEFILSILNDIDLTNDAYSVFVQHDTLYIGDANGLRIYDVSDPLSPSLLGELNDLGTVQCIKVIGHYAYVAKWGGYSNATNGLSIVDVSNPSSLTVVDSWAMGGADRVGFFDLDVIGNYVCAVGPQAGSGYNFTLFDVSDPGNIVLVNGQRLLNGYESVGVDVLGNTAYVFVSRGASNNRYHYLAAVDLTDPGNPTVIGYKSIINVNVSLYENRHGIDVVGDYAYMATSDSGVVVLNIADPENMIQVSRVSTGGKARDVEIVGDSIYVADANSGLYGFDVSDPHSPTKFGQVHTPGQSNVVVIKEYLSYMADGNEGVQIIAIKPNNE